MNETEEAEIRIRAAYASWQGEPSLDGSYIPMTGEEANDEFDAWLAEHDREVAERAWSDALKHVAALSDPAYTMNIPRDRELITLSDVSQAMYENPYRKDAS